VGTVTTKDACVAKVKTEAKCSKANLGRATIAAVTLIPSDNVCLYFLIMLFIEAIAARPTEGFQPLPGRYRCRNADKLASDDVCHWLFSE